MKNYKKTIIIALLFISPNILSHSLKAEKRQKEVSIITNNCPMLISFTNEKYRSGYKYSYFEMRSIRKKYKEKGGENCIKNNPEEYEWYRADLVNKIRSHPGYKGPNPETRKEIFKQSTQN